MALEVQRLSWAWLWAVLSSSQVGVVAGHQGEPAGAGQPDATQPKHGGIHHMHQIRLEPVQRLRHRWPRKGELELGIEGQWQGRHPHHPGSEEGLGSPFGTEDQHLIARRYQMLHRFGETGDDAVNLGQEGFREKSDPHRASRSAW